MDTNPYEPPRPPGQVPDDHSEVMLQQSRARARTSLRVGILLLLIPAIYNYWAFERDMIASGLIPSAFLSPPRVVNGLGFLLGTTMLWFFAFPALEAISRLLHQMFGRATSLESWQTALYHSLWPAAYLAIPGVVLWSLWVYAFYERGENFYVISWMVGIPAHLLAACLYVPLIVRWHSLTRRDHAGSKRT